ncbi:SusC/RagA family TonB-linked outer membrane protein [Mucilaginibacter sp.]|uniref:SusC/RagA family TonB-linked outer membrane protein n=1 Tax=Mucilaginibacter sp. TaxID=1882438 RepID=UPI003AFFFEC7
MKLYLMLFGVFSTLIVSAQTRITGKVTGADDKQPIIGASVKVQGTTTGAVTDANGNFAVSASPGNTLVISYLGYNNRNVVVGSSTTINVSLQPGTNALNEVVVTGYTSQRKQDISGAVATVNVTAAKQLATTSSDQLLQGQASGVTVVTQGTPGATSQVYVRGISNFGNSQPLYVIDGVQTNSMNDVNPNDIESISVLKDAGAAAIYGVAGGNGVVVVTTKRGRGKSTITYDGYYGTQRPLSGNPFNLLGADDYGTLVSRVDPDNPLLIGGKLADYGYQGSAAKGVANAGAAAINPSLYRFDATNPGNDYLIQQFVKGSGTDWFHTLFKPAAIQQHTISASGANEKNNYFLSFGYTNQEGTLHNTYYKRYQGRVNTNFNIKDHIRVGESAQFYYTETPGGLPGGNLAEGNAISYIYRIQPQIPVYDIGGNYGGTYAGPTQLGNANNPFAIQDRTINNYSKGWNLIGTAYAEADLTKHLVARTAFSAQVNNYYYNTYNTNPYESGENHAVPNSAYEGGGFYTNYNWTNTLNYSQIFGKHNVKFLAGYEMKDNYNRQISGQGTNLFSTNPNFVNLSNTQLAGRIVNSGVNGTPTSTLSYFARLDYQYNDKYILGATVRRDGFSAFADGRKYGTFPSVSLAWRISQEEFLKSQTWITDLKLRGSYGAAGFAGNVGGANAFTLFGQGAGNSYYPINGSYNTPTLGFYNTSIGNTQTTWETDKIANGGFDATLFDSKLELSAEYFVKNSSNLLFQVTLPATVGGAAPPAVNVGAVRNKGFDLNATYHIRPAKDLSFDIGASITTFKNTITKLNNDFFTAGSRIGNIVYESVGHPIGSFYGYKQIGYFNSAADVAASPTQDGAAPGAFKFADLNGDGKITTADRTFLGNPNPNITYGINLSGKYKNVDLLAVFYGSQGNKNLNYIKYWTEFYTSLTGNKSRDLVYDSWSPTNLNPKTVDPGLKSSFSTDQTVSSYYVENGSFLKLKTLQIGYTFNPDLVKRVGVDRLRIYVQGANLFTITKYSGLDPEIQPSGSNGNGNNGGIDYGNYPNNERRYILGLNLSF